MPGGMRPGTRQANPAGPTGLSRWNGEEGEAASRAVEGVAGAYPMAEMVWKMAVIIR